MSMNGCTAEQQPRGGSGQDPLLFMDEYDERWLWFSQEEAYDRCMHILSRLCECVVCAWLLYLLGE